MWYTLLQLKKLIDKLKENKNITLLATVEKIGTSLKSNGRLMPFSFVEYLDSEIQSTRKISAGYKSRERILDTQNDSNFPRRARRTLKPGVVISDN